MSLWVYVSDIGLLIVEEIIRRSALIMVLNTEDAMTSIMAINSRVGM